MTWEPDFASKTSDLVRAEAELNEAQHRVARLTAQLSVARDDETSAARKVDAAREALTHAVTR